MDNKQVKLTEDGLKQLEEELEYLKTKKRKEVSEKIKVALGFGDLSENSEYDEAKNEQAQVEARIVSVENMLKNAIVIDESERDTSKVELGATVTIHDIEFDEDITYKLLVLQKLTLMREGSQTSLLLASHLWERLKAK